MDPKISGSVERILTVGITYALAKLSTQWQSLTPDLVVLLMAAGSAAYGWWSNRKAALLTAAANVPEVRKIELDKTQPGSKALNEATPSSVVVS